MLFSTHERCLRRHCVKLELHQGSSTHLAGRISFCRAAFAVSMPHGVSVMNKCLLALLAGWLLLGTVAEARSTYDGQWNITFVTQSGDCNPTYNYSVNIENGVITSPMAETFRGSVSTAGAVRASVAVQDKRASGSGKLTGVRGRGSWTGYSGNQRCAGAWTAERTY